MLSKMCRNRHKLARAGAIAAALFGCLPRAALADASDRFCIIPVRDGAPTEKDIGATWRITSDMFRIPGLPGPVFTPVNRGGQWTIDAERRLVPYQGRFPHSFLDKGHFVVEPWSQRGVAVGYGAGVSVLLPGTGQFVGIEGGGRIDGGPFLLPRRNLTVVISSMGAPKIVEDQSLRAWLTDEEMTAHGMRGIYSIHDAPSLSATIVVDLDRKIHVVTDDGRWQAVGNIGKDDFGHLIESSAAGVVLLVANKSVVAIRRSGNDSDSQFFAETVATASSSGAGSAFLESRLFSQILSYSAGGWFGVQRRWRRFGSDGRLEDIPGGQLELPRPVLFKEGRIQDLPTIGRTLIEASEGFFLYDGKTITPVVDGGRERLGDLPRVYDLPSIKRVLVTTRSGIFELRPEGSLVAISVPFPADGLPMPAIADWPESGVALVSTHAGLFSLDANLEVAPIPGGSQIGLGWLEFSNGTNPSTGEMILTGQGGVFLAVDSQHGRDGTCRDRQQLESKIPRSNICLRPISGTDPASIGFAVGEMVAAPDRHELLFDTVNGLFSLGPDDSVKQIESRSGQFLRHLVSLPWSGDVLADGTVVRADLSVQQVSPVQYSTILGIFPSIQSALIAARQTGGPIKMIRLDGNKYRRIDTAISGIDIGAIVDAPWFGGPIVGNWRGLFLMGRDGALAPFDVEGLKRDFSGRYTFSRLKRGYAANTFFAIRRFQTIYAWMDGWFRITPERRWQPVLGLPREAFVLTTFESETGDALLGTDLGIFAVNQQGQARKLGDSNHGPRRSIRTFAEAPGGQRILAGGDEGLFVVQTASSNVEPLANGSDDVVGSVRRIVASEFANLSLIEASTGSYSFDGTSLSALDELSPASGVSSVAVFPALRRMLVTKSRENEPLMYELNERDAANVCGKPIASHDN
jgi:hypothetical protein